MSLSLVFPTLSIFLSSLLFSSTIINGHQCHETESNALLQFKESFVISKSVSYDHFSYPKTVSWMPSIDCCSWDGIECDELTGHVIAIDLRSSDLYGSIEANNSVFSLVHLQSLDLSYNDFNHSHIPTSIGNLTYLNFLSAAHCNFHGSIPSSLGNLNQLIHLDLGYNGFTKDSFPLSFANLTQLSYLSLERCKLNGEIPSWIMNLTHLNHLNLDRNSFHGEIQPSLFRKEYLRYLSLGFNMLQGEIELGLFLRMRWLSFLSLSYNRLSLLNEKGSFNATLPPLDVLSLESCNLTGAIPTWIANLTGLHSLGLRDNHLHGVIPLSLFTLENLERLTLAGSSLEGKFEFDMFLKFKMLNYLSLSYNKLFLLPGKGSSNGTLPPLEYASLASCNLVQFPSSLQDLNQLVYLDLSSNDFKSVIPNWIWEKKYLQSLSISQSSLRGEISPLICNLKSLVIVDLSFNNLTSTIPSCLGSSSQSLQIMMLQGNKLFGHLPQTYVMGSALKMIDVTENNLQGQLPRELVNCRGLEFLDVSYNKINNSFPYWLGSLPELKVIALGFNEFHGAINCPSVCTFPKLHILDLCHNKFSGNLTPEMIKNWKSMTTSNKSQLLYEDSAVSLKRRNWYTKYISYSFAIYNKGVVTVYEQIQQTFYLMVIIDISSNRISGEIPSALGDLKSLVSLNLSNNLFIGDIPSSFRKLSNLEALDLSLNSLSGKIPQELAELTFLEFFNVSFNNLSGPIPENNQFSTFEGNCFAGNQGLCGIQLKKKCGDSSGSSPTGVDSDHDSESFIEFDWKIILIGYGGGVVAGLALGYAFSSDVLLLLIRIFK